MAYPMRAKDFLAEVDKIARECGLRLVPDQPASFPIRLMPLKSKPKRRRK